MVIQMISALLELLYSCLSLLGKTIIVKFPFSFLKQMHYFPQLQQNNLFGGNISKLS